MIDSVSTIEKIKSGGFWTCRTDLAVDTPYCGLRLFLTVTKNVSEATPYSAGKRRIFGFFSFFATLIAGRNTLFRFVFVFRTRTNTKIVPKTRTQSAYESTAYESH